LNIALWVHRGGRPRANKPLQSSHLLVLLFYSAGIPSRIVCVLICLLEGLHDSVYCPSGGCRTVCRYTKAMNQRTVPCEKRDAFSCTLY
jgi:hypothetical protein